MHDIAVDTPLDFINLKRGLAGWQYTRAGTPPGFMKNSDYQSYFVENSYAVLDYSAVFELKRYTGA